MYIAEDIFNDQMRGLMVARGNYLSAKDKDEKKRYWYLEFRDCDERAFIATMEQMKFGHGGFPTFAEFRTRYNVLMPHSAREAAREYCGKCVNGTVIFRGVVHETKQVRDMAAGCTRCSPNRDIQINPHELFKDRLGYLRTAEAMERDRESGELNPVNDPDVELRFADVELKFIKPAPEPQLAQVPY